MLPREELLKGIENREEMVRIIDLAEQALRTWEVVCTDFLSPPVLIEVQRSFSRLTELKILPWGGYPQAERQRVGIARSDLPLEIEQISIAAIAVEGNFLFDPANHRDFLGAMGGAMGSFFVGGGVGLSFSNKDDVPYFQLLNQGKYLVVVEGSENLKDQAIKILKPLRPENLQSYVTPDSYYE